MKDINNFACKLFDKKKMAERLPSAIYAKWIEAINSNDSLDKATADVIAHAMKEWAIENGCTHFTHWFQPLTGVTAEKHDAFIDMKDGAPILKFSGKNLIKGEPDASSFPSGGLRATFEARGYTYWDCTSPVFIKDGILCIPTVFVSYNGEALDVKEPLLKSIEVVSKAATRVINIFGDKKVTSVKPVIGLEQEYFLVDLDEYNKRNDLILTGKTLLGALPPKGQELENHYFGSIPSRVQAFMKEINEVLWELGIYAKSEHNEVAPGQFEIAPIYADCNIAVDQNQIMMEVLQKTALKHHLVCLLHEKPFKGINGSGKHNNWSLETNTGVNVFNPGTNPHENIQFLTFTCAFIKAVDENQELLRMFSSCPGNDYRLGANEAPPAIVSIFLGDAIQAVLDQLVDEKPTEYKKSNLKEFGISTLSYLPSDNADRNRTSPVAFTGNKFEIRTLGSSMSASYLNIALNTILADALNEIADKMETNKYRQDIRKAAVDICIDIIKKHKRILFNGDGYSTNWVSEAERRGLLNIKTYVEAVKYSDEHDSGKIFINHDIFTKEELEARYDVMYESYYKLKAIEFKTIISMTKTEVYPIVTRNISAYGTNTSMFAKDTVAALYSYMDDSYVAIKKLEEVLAKAETLSSYKEKGLCLLEEGIKYFDIIRDSYDAIEDLLDYNSFTYPKYDKLFFDIDHEARM